jgi:hypothetical protein
MISKARPASAGVVPVGGRTPPQFHWEIDFETIADLTLWLGRGR